jgi:hypothetical protein
MLLFIVLLMGGEAYFGYQYFQQQTAASQKELADLKVKVDSTADYEQKLQDENTKLTLSNADAKASVDDLKLQLQAARHAESQAKAQVAALTPHPAPTPAPPAAPPLMVITFGTITASNGTSYTNCRLLKVQVDGIVISCDTGITQLGYNLLPVALQKEFGFDPTRGPLSDDQVQSLEQKRLEAVAAGK